MIHKNGIDLFYVLVPPPPPPPPPPPSTTINPPGPDPCKKLISINTRMSFINFISQRLLSYDHSYEMCRKSIISVRQLVFF